MMTVNKEKLSGKRALVFGGSRGIGKAAAVELAAGGAEVILAARDEDRLRAVLAELPTPAGQNHRALVVDMSDVDALAKKVRALHDDMAPIHILVNNSGGPPPNQITTAEWEAFSPAFTQHVGAAHTVTRILLPGMLEAGYGRVINIISTSVKQPLAGLAVSNTVRGAMASWSKTLAAEVAAGGVTVNNVLPGATHTERLESLIEGKAKASGQSVDEVTATMKAAIPAGRFGKPEELGAAVAFLASPQAAYITGINLPVDGGRLGCL